MSLEIHHRQKEGIEILDLKGRLTMGEEDLVFQNELQRLIRSRKYKIVLNLESISEIDSQALGTLIAVQARVAKQGGRLVLVNVQPSHMQLFVLLKLEMFFEVYSDEIDAVNSFFPERVVTRVDILSLVQSLTGKQHPSETGPETK